MTEASFWRAALGIPWRRQHAPEPPLIPLDHPPELAALLDSDPPGPCAVTFVADCGAGHLAMWVQQQFQDTTVHCPTCDREAA
jgi:hypothetical protein